MWGSWNKYVNGSVKFSILSPLRISNGTAPKSYVWGKDHRNVGKIGYTLSCYCDQQWSNIWRHKILYGGKHDKQAITMLYSFCQKLKLRCNANIDICNWNINRECMEKVTNAAARILIISNCPVSAIIFNTEIPQKYSDAVTLTFDLHPWHLQLT